MSKLYSLYCRKMSHTVFALGFCFFFPLKAAIDKIQNMFGEISLELKKLHSCLDRWEA